MLKNGDSKCITLPTDWPVEIGETVTILYDRYLLVLPPSATSEAEAVIEDAMRTLINKGVKVEA